MSYRKKKIVILGSTGSIGKSTLKVIEKDKKDFQIMLLTANKNYKELLSQTRKYDVRNVIITDQASYKKFKILNKNHNLNIFNNLDYLKKIIKTKVDYTMSSIVGISGLQPTLNMIKLTKTIAIANKESLICGWNLIKKELKKNSTQMIPIDSEHFSIWYAIKNHNIKNIKKIYLTASGGPLLNMPKRKILTLKVKDILKHPTWKMGNKISVDSSTMMNKIFEIIEARNIFNLSLDKLSILIHPKSYVHAIIEFNDGMIKFVAHETTMQIPIFNSIYRTKKNFYQSNKLDINKINQLNLSKVKKKQFPTIDILNLIPSKISLFDTVLVASNDELVNLYLNSKISYNDISRKILKFLNLKEFANLKKKIPQKIEDIAKINKYVRLKLNTKSV
ncbi:1-deoxy-D-xylulose-5-phosphate reductoisomerase [Candidatus Pelagibacter sp. HIMB1748]|uniref:1-deoxy-D-xylulose-5-phosphate reductoisomerase n=1 Tax=unclassified Candidatus Pelagibacter TaxID=2647897 RepID=UPI003F87B66C